MTEKTLIEAMEQVLADLEAGKYDDDFKRMAAEKEQEIKDRLAFYQTDEFKAILAKFDSSEVTSIDNESIMYRPDDYPVSKVEFDKLWDSIWETHKEEIFEEEECMFEAYQLNWSGYTLRMMHGQGTHVSISKKEAIGE